MCALAERHSDQKSPGISGIAQAVFCDDYSVFQRYMMKKTFFLLLLFSSVLFAETEKHYLETKELSLLEYRVFNENDCQNTAYIMDDMNKLHLVTAGDMLGKNHGRIEKIDEKFLYITEIVKDDAGNWVEKQRKIAMPAD